MDILQRVQGSNALWYRKSTFEEVLNDYERDYPISFPGRTSITWQDTELLSQYRGMATSMANTSADTDAYLSVLAAARSAAT